MLEHALYLQFFFLNIQLVNRMEDYLIGLDEDIWRSTEEGSFDPKVQGCFEVTEDEDILIVNKNKICDINRYMRELDVVSLHVYVHVQGCKTTKEVSDTLKIYYEGIEKLKKCVTTNIYLNQRIQAEGVRVF